MRKAVVVSIFLLSVIVLFFCCGSSMAGMSSIDIGVGVSYDFDDKKYGKDTPGEAGQPGGSDDVAVQKNRMRKKDKDERSSDLSLTPRFHYIYSYNNDDSFELFFAPSLHHDFAEDGESSLQYRDIRASFFKELTKRWSLSGENAFSLGKNDDSEEEQTEEPEISTAEDGSVKSSPELSAETDNTRYYRNRLSMDSRYIYGDNSSVDIGSSYDLLREDVDSDESEAKKNDYDRYSTYIRNEHRFNSKWGTTVQGSYVRGRYKDDTVRKPITEKTAVGAAGEAASAEEKENFVSGDVSEYRFAGSVTNFLSQENSLTVEYDYTAAVYDVDILNDSTIHTGMLRWHHRFSEILEGSAGIGSSLTQTEGSDDHIGLNGLLELSYLQKLGRYSFQLNKTSDMENFDGTDNRGAVDRLSYRLSADRELGRDLSIGGTLEYTEEEGDRAASAERDETGELAAAIEGYQKKIWQAAFGLRYHLMEEVDAGLRYSFSHLEADKDVDSYDEHRVIMSLDWDREWLRW